ncbi:GTP 3',8-cyclase MoaA [Thiorhodospira sibirica]|uniref:GTP 3',8-cyclase MoaA n=1 Tax=Thiorhodospira sibirica TaxID=154347 RepID=UPI00022C0552|nr:GTP 3',8-cyclase MoaA [Thiorhodospira sibirica]
MTKLQDPFGRPIEYLRLSVIDRCNGRCLYCHSGQNEPLLRRDWLDFDALERVVGLFARRGIRRVRLTGGEPLLRKGLAELAARIHALPGIEELALSTNAALLAPQAEALYCAGIRRLNISLDSLQPDTFTRVSGLKLDAVLDGLNAAKAVGFSPIKINMVVMQAINAEEIEAMVAFCQAQGFTLRLIETMPIGTAGQHITHAHYLSLHDLEQRLQHRFGLEPVSLQGGGPARYLRQRGSDFYLGFITPLSRHFCATCNRLRLTADGRLFPCLAQDKAVALGPLLRGGYSDAHIETAIAHALAHKSIPPPLSVNTPNMLKRDMNLTGG